MAAAVGVCLCAGASGMQGLGPIKDDVLLGGWGTGRSKSRVSEDLPSQLEPGLSPHSQSGSWGSRRTSGCSETLQRGGASLGQAASAYKWPWSRCPISEPLVTRWSCPLPLDPSDSGLCWPFLVEAGCLPRQNARVLGWGE